MATIIEDLRFFSIHDLKRLGMLRDGYNGSMNWTRNSEVISTISLFVRLAGDNPSIMLHYTLTHSGEVVVDWVKFRYQESNLPNNTRGYWMFICPLTGNPCRMLYLYRGHFISRKALPSGLIYKCQKYTGYFQTVCRALDFHDDMTELVEALQKPYRKMAYRGKPTRIAKRLMKKETRYEQAIKKWMKSAPR